MSIYAVIDFETTGLSPAHGARPTEIAVVLVQQGKIIDRYQSLMNPGINIPFAIQQLTGITNDMVRSAPSIGNVMKKAASMVGSYPVVAHNAAFDRKFWEQEIPGNRSTRLQFVCSLLLARRLFPDAPNHKLATLVRLLGLPQAAAYHRALADAECTAHLLIRMEQELIKRYRLMSVDYGLLLALQTVSRFQLDKHVREYRGAS
jgi:DNA polymerase-3 subunit epsilon